MALLTLDSKSLHLEVRAGVLESYSPDEDIKKISADVKQLKEKTNDTVLKLTGENSPSEAAKVIENDKEVQKKWKDFLEGVYKPELVSILEAVKAKNEEICPGYKAHIQNN